MWFIRSTRDFSCTKEENDFLLNVIWHTTYIYICSVYIKIVVQAVRMEWRKRGPTATMWDPTRFSLLALARMITHTIPLATFSIRLPSISEEPSISISKSNCGSHVRTYHEWEKIRGREFLAFDSLHYVVFISVCMYTRYVPSVLRSIRSSVACCAHQAGIKLIKIMWPMTSWKSYNAKNHFRLSWSIFLNIKKKIIPVE